MLVTIPAAMCVVFIPPSAAEWVCCCGISGSWSRHGSGNGVYSGVDCA